MSTKYFVGYGSINYIQFSIHIWYTDIERFIYVTYVLICVGHSKANKEMKQMIKQHEINDLRKGAGSTRHYTYFANGIRLSSKRDVLKGIDLKCFSIKRKCKIGGKVEIYNYNTMSFEGDK